MATETTTLEVIISGKDNFSAAASKVMGGVTNLEKGAGRLHTALGHAGSQIKNLVTGPLGLLGLGAGLFTVAGLFEKSVGKAQDFGMEVYKLQKLTGLTAETTSALASAMEHFGVSSDGALRSIGFLEKNVGLLLRGSGLNAAKFTADFGFQLKNTSITATQLGDALDTLKKKKVSHADAMAAETIVEKYSNATTRDANTLILQAADYFNNRLIPAQTKAAALAKLFGRGWQELIPFLAAGSKGIKDAEAAAADLGLTLSQTNLNDLMAFRKTTLELNTAMGGLQLQIGLALVPAMKDFAEATTNFIKNNRTQIVQFFRDGAKFAQDMGHAIGSTVVPMIGAIADAWAKVPGGLKQLLITGFVANKATKFLFDFGIGDVAKGLGGLLGRGASPVNPVFVKDVGGGGIPGAVGAGAGGLLSGAAIFAGLVAVPLASILWQASQVQSDSAQVGPRTVGYGRTSITLPGNGGAADDHFKQFTKNVLAATLSKAQDDAEAAQQLRNAAQSFSQTAEHMKSFWSAIYHKEAALLGFHLDKDGHTIGGKNQIASLATLKGADLELVAETLAHKFQNTKGPYFESMKNQERALNAMEAAQKRAIATGDVKTANALGKDIASMKEVLHRDIDKKKPQPINITIPVTTNIDGRKLESDIKRYESTHFRGADMNP